MGWLGGDVIDLSELLDTGSFLGTTLAQATGGGYVQLAEVAGNVEVRVDLDGGANSFTRSEEHTSELQSLMRISYAVFCLKKKISKPQHATKHSTPIQQRKHKHTN